MTPFTRLKFERLWDTIHVPFLTEYRNGRGRQPSTKPKDALFFLLSVLKLLTTWGNYGAMFAVSTQRVEKLVCRLLKIVAPLVKSEFVREVSYVFCSNYLYNVKLAFVSFYFYQPLTGEYANINVCVCELSNCSLHHRRHCG